LLGTNFFGRVKVEQIGKFLVFGHKNKNSFLLRSQIILKQKLPKVSYVWLLTIRSRAHNYSKSKFERYLSNVLLNNKNDNTTF
jgi:hypothetical protein